MNKTYILITLLILPFFVTAQTVKWALKPAYSSISYFSENLYLVKSGNKSGIVDSYGKFMINDADSITPYVEGHSLSLKKYGNLWIVLGIMDESGKVNKPEGSFFVASYPYFSEGFLSVSNADGAYGFINILGKETIPCKYKTTHPFSEGLSSVTLNNGRVIYINSKEQPLRMEVGDGEIYLGTNFKNGEALVSTIDKKLYFIGKNGKIKSKANAKKLSVDAKYCISSDAKEELIFSEITEKQSADDNIVPYSNGNLYGYKNGNTVVLPPQFDNAFPFVNGTARVCINEKYGLLTVVSNLSVTAKITQTSLKVKKGVPEDVESLVSIPEESDITSFEMVAINQKKHLNEKFSLTGNNGENKVFKFKPNYKKGENQDEYLFQLKAEDLLLWEDRQEILFKPLAEAADFYITVTPESSEANEKDEAWISVNFVNKSDLPMEISVNITGEKLKGILPSSITIPANATQTVRTCFTEVLKKGKRSVKISTSKGNKTASVTLIPFY